MRERLGLDVIASGVDGVVTPHVIGIDGVGGVLPVVIPGRSGLEQRNDQRPVRGDRLSQVLRAGLAGVVGLGDDPRLAVSLYDDRVLDGDVRRPLLEVLDGGSRGPASRRLPASPRA